MTLDQFRPHASALTDPIVALARRLGLGPNAVSVIAFAFALAAGATFYAAGRTHELYLLGAVFVLCNGLLDVVDGALARDLGVSSRAGDLLDHVLDRYADIVVIAGLAAGIDRYALGLAAVTGVLMTSYLGTQSQAVGLDRVYGGLLGRADRLALVGLVAALAAADPEPGGVPLVVGLLALFAVVGHLTALQRFWGAMRALS